MVNRQTPDNDCTQVLTSPGDLGPDGDRPALCFEYLSLLEWDWKISV